jgi:hypothetical protein
MSKISLALVAVVVVAAATLTPSLVVRAQGTTRFEYARVIPYVDTIKGPTSWQQRLGYSACVAGADGWTCRDFKEASSADALRTALVQLGNDGWELVSAAQEEQNNILKNGALTYLFKRPLR